MSSDLYSTQETTRYKSMPTKSPNLVKIFKPSSAMSATELTAGNESVHPHSRKFAKRKAAEQGVEGTDAENDILRNTKCKNCGGSWHIALDCKGKKKDTDKENVDPHPTGKKTPGSGKKNKSYMTQRIGSKMDPCASDEELPQYEDTDEDKSVNPQRLRGFFD